MVNIIRKIKIRFYYERLKRIKARIYKYLYLTSISTLKARLLKDELHSKPQNTIKESLLLLNKSYRADVKAIKILAKTKVCVRRAETYIRNLEELLGEKLLDE